ncbi:glycine zipper 2TM domain-containing protein [Pseudoalteromonas sp. NEC-BIFX-2020_002]|uniref:Glycine zipper 2TM domain-containing protein n=1 Tax=Pseudoalteromonas neustonica TaxID=1840331 RepID=A0ABU9U4A7_9GAMM|nr:MULTISPECIES: glycine zipper 2TM domain-containing protein [unclassified Pseudoalteromonas]NMR27485.1 glycine zipper 2TM domain-containing protein [Pseudoalteromonas sp. NEC-BIFX-2020_015]NNG44924.1 glycine zipper 2TM domain-containing protein [Pseudoalteromonas sp. NEC-BIFX-2020_002]
MKTLTLAFICTLLASSPSFAAYERNKAVPVQQVLFGEVKSVRNITQQELVQDKSSGWKTFGGALLGGVIGNQFGGGSGRTAATILGSVIGGNIAHNKQRSSYYEQYHLVELMIRVENGEQFMVVQDKDNQMHFSTGDDVRLVYLSDNTVRVDKAF